MPSSLTVLAMQSNMPLNLRRPLATMAKLLSWVCSNSFALSIGATIVCTTPPIKAPATRSRWKFFTPQFNAFSCPSFNLFPSESSSSALILRFPATASASQKLCSKRNTPINIICFLSQKTQLGFYFTFEASLSVCGIASILWQ